MGKPSSTVAAAGEAAPLVPYGIPLDPQPNAYLLLPLFRRRRPRPINCCRLFSNSSSLLSSFLLLLLLSLIVVLFFFWPSGPSMHVSSISLNHLRVVTDPVLRLDVSMDLTVRVRNPNFFSLDYDSLVASIDYRGKRLGFVASQGGRIMARGVSYADVQLRLDGIRVVSDVVYLIYDLALGSIPLDTVTDVNGRLRIYSLEIPIKGKTSCSVRVDVVNQAIISQDCYTAE